jgi:hypothetical protein
MREAAMSHGTVMAAIFKRKGGNGEYTKLYESIAVKDRKFFDEKIVDPDERPVIVSVHDENNWFLLSDRRLYSSLEARIFTIKLEEIDHVKVDLHLMRLKMTRMTDQDELTLVTSNNAKCKLKTEPGLPFSGMFSVLKHIEARNALKSKT